MLFKLFRLRLEREMKELKAIHVMEMKDRESEWKRSIAEKDQELELLGKELRRDNDIKQREIVSLLKLESEQKITTMKLNHDRELEKIRNEAKTELLKEKETLIKGTYDKLSQELAKLHSEGDANTKFIQEMSLKMLNAVPERRSRKTKVLLTNDQAEIDK